jgi:uncharacterized protein with NRDE domain
LCTIFVLNQVHAEYPLIIAANRDEFYAREATTPIVLHQEPLVVGGQDKEKGGTWMGVSASGRFAGLTNQRTGSSGDKSRKSRGEVVLNALRAFSLEEAKQQISAIKPTDYNPFNLLFGDASKLYAAYCHEERETVEVQEVPAGLWVLPNDVIDSKKFRKVGRAKALLSDAQHKPWSELQPMLTAALSDHHIDTPSRDVFVPKGSLMPAMFWKRLEALCIHTPLYGTRSSTIVAASHNKIERYLFASGAPCQHSFVDYTHLVR